MVRKKFSFILVPHGAEKFKSITLSGRAVQTLLALSIFIFVALTGFLVDYFTMNVTRAKYRRLIQENNAQKRTIAEYEASVSKLKETLQAFKTYTEKLNVMAGLKSSEVLKEFGIGGGDTEGFEMEARDAGRSPAEPGGNSSGYQGARHQS